MRNNHSRLGYYEEPKDSNGISRARTTGQLRSWEIPRTGRALEAFNYELGGLDYPGIYILLHGNTAYVGEAGSLYGRLKQHMVPEEKWNRAIFISDGRPGTQSDFNDAIVRKALEFHTNRLLAQN